MPERVADLQEAGFVPERSEQLAEDLVRCEDV